MTQQWRFIGSVWQSDDKNKAEILAQIWSRLVVWNWSSDTKFLCVVNFFLNKGFKKIKFSITFGKMRVWLTDLLGVLSCALLLVFSGLKWIKYFDNSVTKIYTSQEDYKPVIFCVHYCQIPIYTAALLVSCQLQIIITLLYIESMPVYFMIQY